MPNVVLILDDRLKKYVRMKKGESGAGNNSVGAVNVILAADCSRNSIPRSGVAV
jgi:hypothetical protein